MRFAILCNSVMGLPSLQALASLQRIASIGIPDTNHEATDLLHSFAGQAALPLSVFTRERFREECCSWLDSVAADAVLVYTFPFVVPTRALDRPRHGILNFHFAPLPAYRGAEPLFWLLRNRAPQGAVTVHRMTTCIDRGPVIMSQPVPIAATDTHGSHMTQLATTAADVTMRLLPMLAGPDPLPSLEQDEAFGRTWPKPGAPDVSIDWNSMGAEDVLALVRACNPWNKGAYAFLGGSPFRVVLAGPSGRPESARAGTLQCDQDGTGWDVACADGHWIQLHTVLLESGFLAARDLGRCGLRPGMRFEYPFSR